MVKKEDNTVDLEDVKETEVSETEEEKWIILPMI